MDSERSIDFTRTSVLGICRGRNGNLFFDGERRAFASAPGVITTQRAWDLPGEFFGLIAGDSFFPFFFFFFKIRNERTSRSFVVERAREALHSVSMRLSSTLERATGLSSPSEGKNSRGIFNFNFRISHSTGRSTLRLDVSVCETRARA